MCPGINSFTFWNLTSASQIGSAVGGAHVAMFAVGASGDRRGGGATVRADVDNTRLKRTASAIMLKVKEIIAFRVNELQGVNSFVMYGISGNFRKTFIPFPSRMAPRRQARLWALLPPTASSLRRESSPPEPGTGSLLRCARTCHVLRREPKSRDQSRRCLPLFPRRTARSRPAG